MVEHHWLLRLGPLEREVFKDPVLLRNTILKRTFIECHRWEVAESRMHSVLDLQSDWSDTEADKPLKETLIQTSLRCFLTHDYWS